MNAIAPQGGFSGTDRFIYTVSDSWLPAFPVQCTIAVSGVAKPQITSALAASATIGQAFTYAITASGLPTSFAATGLPTGLTVNKASGVISGTPATAGTSAVQVSATNTAGTGTASLALTVAKVTPVLTWAVPAAIPWGTALSAVQENATASVPGTFTYSPAVGSVPNVGAQQIQVTFTPVDEVHYTTVTSSVSLVVTKANPLITWAAPAAIAFGTGLSATQLNATAPVAGMFGYSPVSTAVLPAGQQTLTTAFVPADGAHYNTVTATVTLTVNKAAPTITWTAPAAITYGTALSSLQLTATSTVPGSVAFTPALGAILSAGPQTLTATFTPTDVANYTTATASVALTVNKATPGITWTAPAGITYGTALSALQLSASSPFAGTFAYSSALGAVLTAGAQTLTATFTPLDTANYLTAQKTVALTVAQAQPGLQWTAPAGITYGAALTATQLTATAAVPGTFTYSPVLGAVLPAGAQTLTVSFIPVDGVNYLSASTTVSLAVAKATPVLAWSSLSGVTAGAVVGSPAVSATSVTPGVITYSPAAGTVLVAGAQTLTATLAPTDAVNQATVNTPVTITVLPAAGGGDTTPPAQPQVTLSISGGTTGDGHGTFNGQEVSFTNLQQVTATVSATTTSGDLTVTVSTSDGASQNGAAGNFTVPVPNAGLVTITAVATATRNGQSVSNTATATVLVDRTAPILHLAAPAAASLDAMSPDNLDGCLGAPYPGDRLHLWLNGADVPANRVSRQTHGRPVYSASSFILSLQVEDELPCVCQAKALASYPLTNRPALDAPNNQHFTLDLTPGGGVADGSQTASVKLTDAAGNVATVLIGYGIDRSAPRIVTGNSGIDWLHVSSGMWSYGLARPVADPISVERWVTVSQLDVVSAESDTSAAWISTAGGWQPLVETGTGQWLLPQSVPLPIREAVTSTFRTQDQAGNMGEYPLTVRRLANIATQFSQAPQDDGPYLKFVEAPLPWVRSGATRYPYTLLDGNGWLWNHLSYGSGIPPAVPGISDDGTAARYATTGPVEFSEVDCSAQGGEGLRLLSYDQRKSVYRTSGGRLFEQLISQCALTVAGPLRKNGSTTTTEVVNGSYNGGPYGYYYHTYQSSEIKGVLADTYQYMGSSADANQYNSQQTTSVNQWISTSQIEPGDGVNRHAQPAIINAPPSWWDGTANPAIQQRMRVGGPGVLAVQALIDSGVISGPSSTQGEHVNLETRRQAGPALSLPVTQVTSAGFLEVPKIFATPSDATQAQAGLLRVTYDRLVYAQTTGWRWMNLIRLSPDVAANGNVTTLRLTAGFFDTPDLRNFDPSADHVHLRSAEGIDVTLPLDAPHGDVTQESTHARILAQRLTWDPVGATLAQTLEVDVQLGSGLSAGLYDVDIACGNVHAYPDELSQQYAGANGAHRMKEALNVIKVDWLTRDASGGDRPITAILQSVPIPTFTSLSASSFTVAADGRVSGTVSGTIGDQLEGIISDRSRDLASVTVTLIDRYAPDSLPIALGTYPLVAPTRAVDAKWAPFGAPTYVFSIPLSFSLVNHGQYSIELATSPNACGLVGTTNVLLDVEGTLPLAPHAVGTGVGYVDMAAGDSLSLDFSAGIVPDLADAAEFRVIHLSGSTETFSLLETGVKTLIFSGTGTRGAVSISVDAPASFSPSAVDYAWVRISVQRVDGAAEYIDAQFQESAVNSRIFTYQFSRFSSLERLSLGSIQPNTALVTSLYKPIVIQVTGQLLPDDIPASVNGHDFTMRKDPGGGYSMYDAEGKRQVFISIGKSLDTPRLPNVIPSQIDSLSLTFNLPGEK